jgi:hypothetical protein
MTQEHGSNMRMERGKIPWTGDKNPWTYSVYHPTKKNYFLNSWGNDQNFLFVKQITKIPEDSYAWCIYKESLGVDSPGTWIYKEILGWTLQEHYIQDIGYARKYWRNAGAPPKNVLPKNRGVPVWHRPMLHWYHSTFSDKLAEHRLWTRSHFFNWKKTNYRKLQILWTRSILAYFI